jgi:hypothetical protein
MEVKIVKNSILASLTFPTFMLHNEPKPSLKKEYGY